MKSRLFLFCILCIAGYSFYQAQPGILENGHFFSVEEDGLSLDFIKDTITITMLFLAPTKQQEFGQIQKESNSNKQNCFFYLL